MTSIPLGSLDGPNLLVETHLGEVDTQAARERFRGQHRAWERVPDGRGSRLGAQKHLFCSNRGRRFEDGLQKRRAYRKRGGTLYRVYVGKADQVTLERLNDVAKQLFGQGEEEVSSEVELSEESPPHGKRETVLSSDQPTLSEQPSSRTCCILCTEDTMKRLGCDRGKHEPFQALSRGDF